MSATFANPSYFGEVTHIAVGVLESKVISCEDPRCSTGTAARRGKSRLNSLIVKVAGATVGGAVGETEGLAAGAGQGVT
ncbi:hypothetical protein [Sphingorhabdus sp.]|uniref:hypothetical protein n=1 Tax=Sphingorhabdus sp. TaxID=1902408 RepID=UPI004053AB73